MKYNFDSLVESLLKEINVKRIGVYPGMFKPPQKDHFKVCQMASEKNDIIMVLISDKETDGITADQSLGVWSIFKTYIPGIIPFVVSGSLLNACHDIARAFNTGQYSDKTNIQDLLQNSEILQSFLNVGNNIELTIYSSSEKNEIFEDINKEPYTGKTVLGVNIEQIEGSLKSKDFRSALVNKGDVKSFLPCELSDEDIVNAVNILSL